MSAEEFVKSIYPEAYAIKCWGDHVSIVREDANSWHYISDVFRYECWAWENAKARLHKQMMDKLES
jgi:hypothetical protein